MDAALRRAGVKSSCPSVSRVSGKEFYSVFAREHANLGRKGWMVDLHSAREYSKDYKCFLSKDKKSGIAVNKRTGNVVSVFSSVRGGNRMPKLIATAVANGGRRLDCFAAGLQSMYGRNGGRIVGKLKFDPSIGKTIAGWDGRTPDVVMMSLPSSLNAWARQYSASRITDLASLRYSATWDDMEAKADKAVSRRIESEKALGDIGDALGSGK